MNAGPILQRDGNGAEHEAVPSAAIPSAEVPSEAVPSASPSVGIPGDISAGVSGASEVSGGSGGGRRTFEAFELARVLSHYDIGAIEEIVDFPRGSRKAPKLMLRSDKGLYLLKRRARGKDEPRKVAFCHGLQHHLADRQYPLPHLIGTRKSNNSMLKLDGCTYELFEYIKGNSYDQSLEATTDAGRVLSLFHKLSYSFSSEYKPSRGTYHNSRSVKLSMTKAPETLMQVAPQADAAATYRLVNELNALYLQAIDRVDMEGLPAWPEQVIHSDWHPGNLLYRGGRVVAVIDYDAARYGQRIIDTANGVLQFSIQANGSEPEGWPVEPDRSRFKRFMRGYDSVPDMMLSRAEIRVVPWLMIQALIAESIIPIAAVGYFAKLPGLRFLAMVLRKARWLADHRDELIELVEE
jgi:homoserine kinase type II